jgi:acetyltransferase
VRTAAEALWRPRSAWRLDETGEDGDADEDGLCEGLRLAMASPFAGRPFPEARPDRRSDGDGDDTAHALRDGRRVRLRPITAHDATAEQRFVEGLSMEARYYRFHTPIRTLSPDVLGRMVRLDPRQFALVATPHAAPDDDEGHWDVDAAPGDPAAPLVADARYVLADDADDRAEFAIAIADAWQGAGLGRVMLERLKAHARRQGIRSLHGDVLHDNRAMASLLRQVGGTFVPGDDPRVRRAVIRLD